MSELNMYLARIQDIAARARSFQANEGSDPKEFSRAVVEDLGTIADAIIELIKSTAGPQTSQDDVTSEL